MVTTWRAVYVRLTFVEFEPMQDVMEENRAYAGGEADSFGEGARHNAIVRMATARTYSVCGIASSSLRVRRDDRCSLSPSSEAAGPPASSSKCHWQWGQRR